MTPSLEYSQREIDEIKTDLKESEEETKIVCAMIGSLSEQMEISAKKVK